MVAVNFFTPLWHDDHRYLTTIINGTHMHTNITSYSGGCSGMCHSNRWGISSLPPSHLLPFLLSLLPLLSPALVKLCPDRGLVENWEKNQETMRNLQLCIGFGPQVQVTASQQISHSDFQLRTSFPFTFTYNMHMHTCTHTHTHTHTLQCLSHFMWWYLAGFSFTRVRLLSLRRNERGRWGPTYLSPN